MSHRRDKQLIYGGFLIGLTIGSVFLSVATVVGIFIWAHHMFIIGVSRRGMMFLTGLLAVPVCALALGMSLIHKARHMPTTKISSERSDQ